MSLYMTFDVARPSVVQLTGTSTTNAAIVMGTNILSLPSIEEVY